MILDTLVTRYELRPEELTSHSSLRSAKEENERTRLENKRHSPTLHVVALAN